MALTPSTMLALGTRAPDFDLPDPKGNRFTLSSFRDAKAIVIIFMCNHCPYVKHLRSGLAQFARDYRDQPVAIIGINSNDAENYPDDSPAQMSREITAAGYSFPYLVDADQKVAKAYHAACTPDFFLFDAARSLVYRGQFDDSRPGNGIPVTGSNLRAAVDSIIVGKAVSSNQKPSIGCNIKWKPGNQPSYS